MNFIKVPFADSGDKTPVPETDAGGSVNMTQGYTQAYSLDPATDPSAKRIEREKMNGLFNVITAALNEIQTRGVATFISSNDNGGSPFSYGKGSVVILDGVVYQSLVDGNTDTPPSSKWAAAFSDGAGSPPIGIPFFWPSSAMPNTVMPEWSDMVFLKFNGATFSATTYPKLALVIPSLTLTEARGEFPRIWDDGRGVDSGRALLSAQSDAIRNITGSLNGVVNYQSGASSGAFTNPSSGNSVNLATGQSGVGNPNFDASRVVPTAAENRPRNIAFNFLVRAK